MNKENDLPEGYVELAPGSEIGVPSIWLSQVLSTARPKKKGKEIKPQGILNGSSVLIINKNRH